jgi:hypothetical protein
MRLALCTLLLLALPAFTADTPLTDILIDGEGWKPAGDTMFKLVPTAYLSKRDDKGNWGVYKGDKLVARAGKGEVFGETALSPLSGRERHCRVWRHQNSQTIHSTGGGPPLQRRGWAMTTPHFSRRERPVLYPPIALLGRWLITTQPL